MTDIVFPGELGSPLLSSWSETPPNLVFRTSMEEGPQKTRRWGTAGSGKINVTYNWSKEQRDLWKLFYNNTIASGALEFMWRHPIDDIDIKVRLQNVPAETLATYNRFSYNLELERLP